MWGWLKTGACLADWGWRRVLSGKVRWGVRSCGRGSQACCGWPARGRVVADAAAQVSMLSRPSTSCSICSNGASLSSSWAMVTTVEAVDEWSGALLRGAMLIGLGRLGCCQAICHGFCARDCIVVRIGAGVACWEEEVAAEAGLLSVLPVGGERNSLSAI
jgi:hypothetical protein